MGVLQSQSSHASGSIYDCRPSLHYRRTRFYWHRRQQPFHTDTIGSLVMYIGSPCLIYSSLTSNSPSLTTLAQTASIAAFVIICSTAFAFAFLRVTGWSYRTYVPALVLPNGGNMGLPICLLAFGETGLALGMAYFLLTQFLNTHWGWPFLQANST